MKYTTLQPHWPPTFEMGTHEMERGLFTTFVIVNEHQQCSTGLPGEHEAVSSGWHGILEMPQ